MKLLFKLNGQKVLLFLVACFAVPGTGMARQPKVRQAPLARIELTPEQLKKMQANQVRKAAGIIKPKKGEKSKEYYANMSAAATNQGNGFLATHYARRQIAPETLSAAQIAAGKKQGAKLDQVIKEKQASVVAKMRPSKPTAAPKPSKAELEAQQKAAQEKALKEAQAAYREKAAARKKLGWFGRNIFSRGTNQKLKSAQQQIRAGNTDLDKVLGDHKIQKKRGEIKTKAWANWLVGN